MSGVNVLHYDFCGLMYNWKSGSVVI